jgi:alpha-tubulin suppressor-like RCC1 family protein
VTAISTGEYHTCALISTGSVKCWGNNNEGQLGDGTTTNRTTPIDVSGLASSVTMISAGGSHTCALTSAGGAKCWGYNPYGELGDGTSTIRSAPVDVIGLTSGVKAISLGGNYTCALTSAGGVKCWGDNENGQLGDGTTTGHNTPTDVSSLTSGVTAISAGENHTCALTSTGNIKCWGKNNYGQLGDGTTTNYSTFYSTSVNVSGLASGVIAISTGMYNTCALTSAGGVKCWGNNWAGQLGDGTTSNRYIPVDVNSLTSGVSAISSGGGHICILTISGGVKCWGHNFYGDLGDGTSSNRTMPVDVVGLTSGTIAIALGEKHTCALTSIGGVKCWGLNHHGQLGDGTTISSSIPVDASGLTSGVIAISVGAGEEDEAEIHHTCALTSAGGVKCWGDNDYGQLGDGTTIDHITPVVVSGLTSGVTAIAEGEEHTCAITFAGGVKCWGHNTSGQLGDGTTTDRSTPVDVTGLSSGVSAISSGGEQNCVLMSNGGVKCWGSNWHGDLTTNHFTPVDVTGLTSGVIAISVGGDHACALTSSGGVKCWGDNEYGQLGVNPNPDPGWTPVDVVWQ